MKAGAQSRVSEAPLPLPRAESAIGQWDAAVVRRAAQMLASPARWSRSDSASCLRDAKSLALRCALENAIDDVDGRAQTTPRSAVLKPSSRATQVNCALSRVGERVEGSCGLLFDEPTVFSIARAKAITTGVWRADASPTEVWAGRMINAGEPVLQQARKLVDSIAPGKYRNARLAEFNDDSTVSFGELQSFFRSLEAGVRAVTPRDVAAAADDVEIELYGGGSGVIRTYNGWYPVSGFSVEGSSVRFVIDTTAEVPPNALDREILRRADALLSSDAVWNRADNRKCDPAATAWSIYCALEKATREVTGGFHHRRPALETVRVLVDERTKDRDYSHRLMDYNNDRSTTLADVRSLFAAALARMK